MIQSYPKEYIDPLPVTNEIPYALFFIRLWIDDHPI